MIIDFLYLLLYRLYKMPRHKEPFLIKQRPPYWYWKPRNSTWKSTGIKLKEMTERQITAHLHILIIEKPTERIRLKDFTKNFFIWGTCDWIKRQHDAGRSFSEAVAKARRSQLVNYILPGFGDKYLDEISKREIESWIAGLYLSDQTKKHMIYTFKIVMQDAEDDDKIKKNPLARLSRRGLVSKKRDVFTLEELKLLFPDDMEAMLRIWRHLKYAAEALLSATTGMRAQETLALIWAKIFWDTNDILVDVAVKNNHRIGTTKNKMKGLVLMPDKTKKVLRQWYEETPFRAPDDLVFWGQNRGCIAWIRNISVAFKKALENAEIKTGTRYLTHHCFRHTYNTIMSNYIPGALLREQLRHKTPEMTAHYDNPSIEDLRKRIEPARAVVDSVFN